MKLNLVLAGIGAAAAAALSTPDPEFLFANPAADHARASHFTIPTSRQSAVLARRVLALTPLGTLATVFPDDGGPPPSSMERRPTGMGGSPVGLPDYVADCDGSDAGNPTGNSARHERDRLAW